jgi:hypothetical protein
MNDTQVLNNQQKCGIIERTPQQSTEAQIVKLLRRIQALPDGRHEIIITCGGGVQDWTVRTIGKVER